jgi:hypothetical protein
MARSVTAAFVTGRAGRCRSEHEQLDHLVIDCDVHAVVGSFGLWEPRALFYIFTPVYEVGGRDGGVTLSVCRIPFALDQHYVLQLLVMRAGY